MTKHHSVSPTRQSESTQPPFQLIYPGLDILVDMHTTITINGERAFREKNTSRFFLAYASRVGVVVSNHDVMAELYGENPTTSQNLVSVYAFKIRKELERFSSGSGHLLHNHTSGYWLECPEGVKPRVRISFTRGNALLTIDTADIARVNETQVDITLHEIALFEMLHATPGKVWTNEALMQAMYGGQGGPERGLKVLDVFICTMRKKLEAAHPDLADCIESVWGRGYLLLDSTPQVPKVLTIFEERGYVVVRGFGDITYDDLPHRGSRWIPKRKVLLLELVKQQLLTLEELLAHYTDMTEGEFRLWQEKFELGGYAALLTNHSRVAQ